MPDQGATTGDGTTISPRTDDPVMTTGDGKILSGPDAGTTVSTGDDTNTDDMTKAELMEKAKEADISGRSSMTKDELAEALDKK
jgi:hypothetical protein